MPTLLGLDVSPDVLEANQHLLEQKKQPKTNVQKEIARMKREQLERQFDAIWVQGGGDPDFWEHSFKFDDERGWSIDRYNPEHKIGVEIHGGQFMKRSGHNNATGVQRDWEKANRCNELGITLFGLTTAMVNTTEIDKIIAFVKGVVAE